MLRLGQKISMVCVTAAMLAAPAAARAGDFMDTRISFTVSDDNVLQGPRNTNPSSPTFPSFLGSANNVQFYDNYDTKFSGFETMSNLAIFKRMPSFFKNIDTEAGLVLNALVRDDSTVQLGDAGSFLRIVFPLGGNKERNNINFVAFPVSSDRFRGGYSYAISWGGSPIFPGRGPVPGFKLTLVQPKWYLYVGAKTTLRPRKQPDGTTEVDTVGGGLLGFGVDFTESFTIEGNAGIFDRGQIDKREVEREKLVGFGSSLQIAYHRGVPIGTSIDFQLYRNDPDMPMKFFTPEIYDDGFSVLVKAEFSLLGQTLQNINAPQSTKLQLAHAGDLNFAAKYRHVRFFLDAVYRSLSFIMYNSPGYPSYDDFPYGADAEPELFLAAGFDYFIAAAHLTPGLKFGVQRPAFYRGPIAAGANPPQSLAGPQTVIIRDPGAPPDILDAGLDVEPVLAMTASAKWDISEMMSAAAQILVRYDTNKSTLSPDPNGINVTRTLLPPWSLGFNILLQSRF
ncbi:MAG: hypothetical protein IT381_04930 [Deltaproteobacteria bacterium]|nr:hypothetical protein [Deltaproteobacteria bacterium]